MRVFRTFGISATILGVIVFLLWGAGTPSAEAAGHRQNPEPTSTRPLPPPLQSPTPVSSTPTPTQVSSPETLIGGQIELQVMFPKSWPWSEVHWQKLETHVQWQDRSGKWHDVVGWRGGLDDVSIDASGEVIGKKIWWVGEADLGKGPFRWLVFRGETGKLLGTSEAFYLPVSGGDAVQVKVLIGPP